MKGDKTKVKQMKPVEEQSKRPMRSTTLPKQLGRLGVYWHVRIKLRRRKRGGSDDL